MRIAATLATAGVLLAAGDLPVWVTEKAADVTISARVILDKEAQVQAVGSDLNRQYVIVEVKLVPRGGYPVTMTREDFLLRSARDAEKSTAESPERIAGSAVLVLGEGGQSRPIYSQSGDPVFVGGFPGTGGRPRRLGSEDTFGAPAGATEAAVAPSKAKETPLLGTLQEKEVRLGEIRKPVTGLLYFPVDPKQKVKNLWLHYKGAGGTADLHFR